MKALIMQDNDYAGQPMLKVHPDADYGSIILILLTPVYSI
jgi:hypothetical protein